MARMTASAPPRPPGPARTASDGKPLEREEIEALVRALIEEARRETRRRHRTYWAAAALVAMIAGGVAWSIASRRSTLTRGLTAGVDSAPATPAQSPTRIGPAAVAVASYREAARDLERALDAGRSALRPETMQVIEANLRAMDVAIAQADSALQQDPGSEYLNQYLVATMQRKLKLLRHAVAITSPRT